MLNVKLPKTHYNTTTYPLLEERADGAPIPLAYGDLHNIIPVCIDTSAQTYKIAAHAIHAIDEVRTERETLLTADYTKDLANGQFTIAVATTPYLAAGTYWFVLEASFAINASNYIRFSRWNKTAAEYSSYSIDGSATPVWTEDATHYLQHSIFGRDAIDGGDTRRIAPGRQTTWSTLALRDNAARTRIAQKLVVTSAFYLTKIVMEYQYLGTVSGNVTLSILSDDSPETQVGADSIALAINRTTRWNGPQFAWPLRAVDLSTIYCDIEGAEKSGAPIVDGADFLEDLIMTRLGKASTILNAVALADFKTKRAQAINAYLDEDGITFSEILGKLESSLLFKLIPLHDGTYAPTVYAAGDPLSGPPPHFFDEHFLSFSMHRNFEAVKATVNVLYDEDPGNSAISLSTVSSNVAKFVYGNEETLEVETYLTSGVNAATLAASYLGMYETPPLEITFEIRGYGLNLIPGRDKVKITRTRAAYTSGILNGILFRIVRITKKPATASTEIFAVLDTQTY